MPVIRHRLISRVLEGNPLGDPVARDLFVYVPPDYESGVIEALAGDARARRLHRQRRVLVQTSIH